MAKSKIEIIGEWLARELHAWKMEREAADGKFRDQSAPTRSWKHSKSNSSRTRMAVLGGNEARELDDVGLRKAAASKFRAATDAGP
jgi:hypothetical protein